MAIPLRRTAVAVGRAVGLVVSGRRGSSCGAIVRWGLAPLGSRTALGRGRFGRSGATGAFGSLLGGVSKDRGTTWNPVASAAAVNTPNAAIVSFFKSIDLSATWARAADELVPAAP